MKIGVFCSGGGSNLQALLDRQASGELGAEVVFVLSNNSNCKALERAKKAGIFTVHMSSQTHPKTEKFETALLELVKNSGIKLLVLAGYMKHVPDCVTEVLNGQVINIHPALLPAFGGRGMYGTRVHEAVVRSGARFSGPTVHFVNSDYDRGLIIAQKVVPVYPEDSADDVGTRVLKQEHDLLWRVVRAFAHSGVDIRKGRVFLDLDT